MIEKLEIKNFRSHVSLVLDHLARVNILIGRNNSGKTALLEALALALFPPQPEQVLETLYAQHGYRLEPGLEESWKSLFHGWDARNPIEIRLAQHTSYAASVVNALKIQAIYGKQVGGVTSTIEAATFKDVVVGLSFEYQIGQRKYQKKIPTVQQQPEGDWYESQVRDQEPSQPAAFLTSRGIFNIQEEIERYSRLELAGLETEVVQAMQLVEPRLKRLTVLTQGKSSQLYGDLGEKPYQPIALMGEGTVRLLSIIMSIVGNVRGVVLIDEIENGFHYSVLEDVWRIIFKAARQHDVQVFIATHSDECLSAASRVVQNLNYQDDLRLFRLDRLETGTRVIDYSAESLATAIASEQEVR